HPHQRRSQPRDGPGPLRPGKRVDLIVMGAYSQSRLRQKVFGGVTQSVLKHMAAPVFLSH
ncbi:MAG: universal stress protein, partial [Thermodesulfobacteriota bacterium]